MSLAPLIVESERIIAEGIKHFGLKIPANMICCTIQSKGRKKALGWFGPNRWDAGQKDRVHEINLSAEHLKENDCGETLIHELAHAENNFLGIMDCTASQAHNKHFKSMAERLGLTVKPRDKRFGYGFTELGPDAKAFLKKSKFEAKLFSTFRVTADKKKSAGTRMLKVECLDCGYNLRTTQKWLDVGLPTCCCGTEMEAV